MAVLELVDRAELNRGKKAKSKGDAASKAEAPAVSADPLTKIRKAFAGKSRSAGAATAKAAKPAKAGKAGKPAKAASSSRKIPSGGKQGGSSSG